MVHVVFGTVCMVFASKISMFLFLSPWINFAQSSFAFSGGKSTPTGTPAPLVVLVTNSRYAKLSPTWRLVAVVLQVVLRGFCKRCCRGFYRGVEDHH